MRPPNFAPPTVRSLTKIFLFLAALWLGVSPSLRAETLEERVARLEKEVAELKTKLDGSTKSATPVKSANVVAVSVSNKHFQPTDSERRILQSGIYWDTKFTLAADAKPTRAIKGTLVFSDLFNESKVRVKWTINQPLKPGESVVEKGTGIDYNQFLARDQWLKNTELKDMKVSFEVESIIYAD